MKLTNIPRICFKVPHIVKAYGFILFFVLLLSKMVYKGCGLNEIVKIAPRGTSISRSVGPRHTMAMARGVNNRIFFSMMGSIRPLGALLMICLLFCCIDAKDPLSNVNLSPYEKWRSAYECLQNTSLACPGNFQLTEKGNMDINSSQTTNYCNSGCSIHTRAILKCLYYVKQDYIFMNKATIDDINNTISDGCKNGFTGGTLITNNAEKAYGSKGIAILLATIAWSFMTYMNI